MEGDIKVFMGTVLAFIAVLLLLIANPLLGT